MSQNQYFRAGTGCIIYNDKQNLYQELQLNKNIFDYELIKNLSKAYMYN